MKTAEEIVKRSAFDQYNNFFKVSLEDMDWLVEQAETLELAQEKIKAMAEYIANGIEMGYIDDREGDYKKLV
jgi:hypothetical protein